MRRAQSGMTLIEIMIALAVVAIALLAVMSAVSASITLQETNREKTLAYSAARDLLEQMRDETFADLYGRYNNSGNDDPTGVSSPGAAFAVEGLHGDGNQSVGQILFPDDGQGGGLVETTSDAAIGMTQGKDLNGDGSISSTPLGPRDYAILPVRIRISWTGVRGRTELEVRSFISEK